MEQEVSDIVLFLGRFHPMILHLPIGFLVMAAILEGFSRSKKSIQYEPAIRLILLLGSISAVATALLGYLLAQEDGPIIIEGNAGESAMIRRIHLPEHHDEHMPPEGKCPLTEEYKDLLAWWIDSGPL